MQSITESRILDCSDCSTVTLSRWHLLRLVAQVARQRDKQTVNDSFDSFVVQIADDFSQSACECDAMSLCFFLLACQRIQLKLISCLDSFNFQSNMCTSASVCVCVCSVLFCQSAALIVAPYWMHKMLSLSLRPCSVWASAVWRCFFHRQVTNSEVAAKRLIGIRKKSTNCEAAK